MHVIQQRLNSLIVVAGMLVGCADTPVQPHTGYVVPARDRHVALDGQPNFRDLGGYKTTDGRTVKWGQVYRSGELPRLTDEDVSRLAKLHIKTVVNFLAPGEIEASGADRLPVGVIEIYSPIDTEDNLAITLVEARKTGDFSAVPVDINPELHRILVREAGPQYAALLREIADPDSRPIVFHCSHGVHRTGTASAILLWTLGVPWDTVRADYLLSNTYRGAEVETRTAQLRELAAANQGVAPEQVDMTNINAFYILEGSYIDATRDEILDRYGSIDGYLREGLGLSDDQVRRLRDELLEP